jgi:hypothetical protein
MGSGFEDVKFVFKPKFSRSFIVKYIELDRRVKPGMTARGAQE